jgi:hypothetical protein
VFDAFAVGKGNDAGAGGGHGEHCSALGEEKANAKVYTGMEWSLLQEWSRPVPRVEDRLLKAVIYLYKDEAAANSGAPGYTYRWSTGQAHLRSQRERLAPPLRWGRHSRYTDRLRSEGCSRLLPRLRATGMVCNA